MFFHCLHTVQIYDDKVCQLAGIETAELVLQVKQGGAATGGQVHRVRGLQGVLQILHGRKVFSAHNVDVVFRALSNFPSILIIDYLLFNIYNLSWFLSLLCILLIFIMFYSHFIEYMTRIRNVTSTTELRCSVCSFFMMWDVLLAVMAWRMAFSIEGL